MGPTAVRAGGTRLTRRRVLEAALALVDREGLRTLSMRRLGAVLGVDPMAAYNHVDGKEALLDGLVELLWERVPLPAPDGDWVEELRRLSHTLRELFHEHPHAAPLLLGRSVIPTPALALIAAHLTILRAQGFGDRAAEIVRTLLSYSLGYGVAELTCLGTPGTARAAQRPSERELLVCLGQALPPGTPVDLIDAAVAVYADCDPDACFRSGLELLLDGIRALQPPRAKRRRPSGRPEGSAGR